ncbi:type II toxin-antitoxin system Phd/YefM family antitoxin [Frankia sp. CiP3]|uniref:type II toxin-antitoxin system Phd/YefM family antitoxin n=2 Tax=Frankia sp. CiP3 TaxID=2880971 RepID=UPI001EF59285|nr:type II toxin-antitoxin system prevent-host-death family antitoxin [Frankia sp. CiP3]
MKSMTATQAARNFASVLDAVEHGQVVVITRDGVTVGRFVPERRTTADRLKDALREHTPDPAFADDLEAIRADVRASFTDQVRTWPDV